MVAQFSPLMLSSACLGCCLPACPGVAVSHDGVSWLRGEGQVEGHRGAEQAGDVGVVLRPNTDNWWTLDTCHLAVSDVQVGLDDSNDPTGMTLCCCCCSAVLAGWRSIFCPAYWQNHGQVTAR
jgi:hypothetical protein